MENNNTWYIEPQGSVLERAIINTLNFLTDIVYEKIIKPQEESITKHDNDIENIKTENFETLNTINDLQFENDVLKDDVFETLNQTIDLEFRVSQLEDKEAK